MRVGSGVGSRGSKRPRRWWEPWWGGSVGHYSIHIQFASCICVIYICGTPWCSRDTGGGGGGGGGVISGSGMFGISLSVGPVTRIIQECSGTEGVQPG